MIAAGSLRRVPNPAFGYSWQISFLESYQITPNICQTVEL